MRAPFTEFLWLGLKEGAKAEELEEGIQNVEAIFPGAVAEGISVGGFGGKYVDGGDHLLFGGWTSPEVRAKYHPEARSFITEREKVVLGYVKRPENWAKVSKVGPLANVDLTFAKLTSYKE